MFCCWSTLVVAGCLVIAASPLARSETYLQWAETHFSPAEVAAGMAAPNHDPDGDSCPNILEYAAACAPLDPDSSLRLSLHFDPVLEEVTVSFPVAPDRYDIESMILVSNDLSHWTPGAIFICDGPSHTYHLNGHRYAKIGIRPKPGMMLDSDADGLSDHFEESLIHADPGDPFLHIGQIRPHDDFDGDGIPNIEEEANMPAPATFTKPALLDPQRLACALDGAAPPSPGTLRVHTLLK